MSTQQQQIVDKCKAVFAKAKELYPHLEFEHVAIRFDLKGRCAGMAGGSRYGGSSKDYWMKFNRDMLAREAFDHLLNDTVPHEIAHIVCFMDKRLGNNHNSGWAHVCRKLGGSGDRTHKEEVVYGKGLTYEYTSTTGHQLRVSQSIHRRIQLGQTRAFRGGKGQLTKDCAHQVVGAGGRTLAAPVRKVEAKTPVNAPVEIEKAVRTNPLPAHILDRFRVSLVAPVAKPVQTPVAAFASGNSKASISRAIMLSGYRGNKTYEEIIAAMIAANGYDRQLARATFKANAPKVGIPADWGN